MQSRAEPTWDQGNTPGHPKTVYRSCQPTAGRLLLRSGHLAQKCTAWSDLFTTRLARRLCQKPTNTVLRVLLQSFRFYDCSKPLPGRSEAAPVLAGGEPMLRTSLGQVRANLALFWYNVGRCTGMWAACRSERFSVYIIETVRKRAGTSSAVARLRGRARARVRSPTLCFSALTCGTAFSLAAIFGANSP